MCVVYSLPYSSCMLKKKRPGIESRLSLKNQHILDSARRDSFFTSEKINAFLSGNKVQMLKTTKNEVPKIINLLSEKHAAPFDVKGETYRTSITANWVLDTTDLHGKSELTYFDMDNPTLKARIYSDTLGKMQIEIHTKGNQYQVSVDRVKIHSSNVIQQNSNANAERVGRQGTQKTTKDSLVVLRSDMQLTKNAMSDNLYLSIPPSKNGREISWLFSIILLSLITTIIMLPKCFRWLLRIVDFLKKGGKHV